MVMMPFSEWLPDIPSLGNPGALTAKNVYPVAVGYRKTRELVTYTNALDTPCLGIGFGISGTGDTYVFCGDTEKLYKLANATWSDVSVGGGYSTAAGGMWDLVEFGMASRLIIATNYADPIQKFAMGVDSAFSNLSATAPKARYLGVVGDFLVAANVYDSVDGALPGRIAWGPVGDPTGVWTPSSTTQADFQDLRSGGEITGFVGGEYGSILCRKAVHRLTYTGGQGIFRLDEVATGVGCVAPGSVASYGGRTIFLSEEGFMLFDGNSLVPIGANKINDWFTDNVNAAQYSRITAGVDPKNGLYYCAFPSPGKSDPDTILVFNWVLGRWSYIEQELTMLGQLLSPGYTLEQLNNVSSSLDALPASLDSRQWAGGGKVLGAFGTDNKFGSFGGSVRTAVLETGEQQLGALNYGSFKAFVRGARPMVDGPVQVELGYRNDYADAVAWTAPTTPHARTGIAPMRNEARFHRFRVTTLGDFNEALGVEPEHKPGSRA